MPRIFDNIEQPLLNALLQTLRVSHRADFCVGYFNLRGWKKLDQPINDFAGSDGQCCRLLVGMQRLPQEDLQALFRLDPQDDGIDNATAARRKKEIVDAFREQLTLGAPSNEDEAGLRRLAAQIKAQKVVVRLFLAYPLHAKLYLLFRPEPVNPNVGFVGSSNLTLSGLSRQGELNVDVLDQDAFAKLARWFEDRWEDPWCMDISADLTRVIDESWAREQPIPPYHIYVKMAYHLSQEARAGISEFRIPRDFGDELFEFQVKAVQIAAHHLNKRGGVLLGDVVGLGKTLIATALARIFEDDQGLETLILCPKNLVPMWEEYRIRYRLRGAKVLSMSLARRDLPNLPRFRLVVIDESHNLRNREGQTYRAIREYVERNDSKCILLSATPYNKTYLDLSNQLRLFLTEEQDLGTRPERLLREIGETEFLRRHQCGVRTLAAFEKSLHTDDWRELMRLFLVRRTRSFIKEHYADTDPDTGRKYLTAANGTRMPFPERVPKTVKVGIDRRNAADQYARLYDDDVVDTINRLHLPRYGLANYLAPSPDEPPTRAESSLLGNLSRAGNRLLGFCRTNLFKRLESSGHAFLLSLKRHVLRNCVVLHALSNGLPLPLGTQDADLLDPRFNDNDGLWGSRGDDDSAGDDPEAIPVDLNSEQDFTDRAEETYRRYAGPLKSRFSWLRPSLFVRELADHLRDDVRALLGVLNKSGPWDPDADQKLKALVKLLTRTHPADKVLIFSQFADTVCYLAPQLQRLGVKAVEGVTGDSEEPTALAWRFSPVSNGKRDQVSASQELRVLVATDVLSEGQNLQDAAVVVNFDLPWAIIRLVQRAGRVDRIGQKANTILCYSFLPADGVERVIRLRDRVRQRLRENAEVVGTDEAFFEDDRGATTLHDLYNEKAGLLDGESDTEIDLASHAYQIWSDAVAADPTLEQTIKAMSNVVYSTRSHPATAQAAGGVLVYFRTAQGNDALAWVDEQGHSITESQFAILDAARCAPDTPALPRRQDHHDLVRRAAEVAVREEKQVGGQLGRPSGARFRTYDRLRTFADADRGSLFESQELLRAVEEIYRFPLFDFARDTLNRQLKAGVSDPDLVELVLTLRREGRLCQIQDEKVRQEPHILCSIGLVSGTE
jgi:superfamily II DNA or RNA helicase